MIRQHWVPLLKEYDVDGAFEHDNHTDKRTHLLWESDPIRVTYFGDGA